MKKFGRLSLLTGRIANSSGSSGQEKLVVAMQVMLL